MSPQWTAFLSHCGCQGELLGMTRNRPLLSLQLSAWMFCGPLFSAVNLLHRIHSFDIVHLSQGECLRQRLTGLQKASWDWERIMCVVYKPGHIFTLQMHYKDVAVRKKTSFYRFSIVFPWSLSRSLWTLFNFVVAGWAFKSCWNDQNGCGRTGARYNIVVLGKLRRKDTAVVELR